MLFKGSVRGLNIGAPVDFRGVVVGEVTEIRVKFVAPDKDIDMAVAMRVYPERLRALYLTPVTDSSPDREHRVGPPAMPRGGRQRWSGVSVARPGLLTGLPFVPKPTAQQLARSDAVHVEDRLFAKGQTVGPGQQGILGGDFQFFAAGL